MKYVKHLLEKVFENNRLADGQNPDSVFLAGFTAGQLDELENSLHPTLQQIGRPFVFIDAERKTFLEIVELVTGEKYSQLHSAYEAIENAMYHQDKIIVIKNLSRSRIQLNLHGATARKLVKILDDAHFKNISPKSDLVFIDYASFLEKHWDLIGAYLVYNLWPNSLMISEYFDQMYDLSKKLN